MVHRRVPRSCLLLVLLLLAAAPAPAAEDPADFDTALAGCRAEVRRGRWKEAVERYAALFDAFRDDPRPVRRMRVIEDDLKLAHFRLECPSPPDRELFRGAAEKFSRPTRKVELSFPKGPAGPLWEDFEGQAWLLDLQFEGDLLLDLKGPIAASSTPGGDPDSLLVVLICYDPDEDSGYRLTPGYHKEEGQWVTSAPASIARLGDGTAEVLASGKGMPHTTRVVRIEKKRDRIGIVGSAPGAVAEDRRLKDGAILVAGVRPRAISVSGRVTRDCLRDLENRHESDSFLAWEESAWDPAKAIPEWVRERLEARRVTHPARLPADAEPALREAVTDAVFGDALGVVRAGVEGIAGVDVPTAEYLRAVALYGSGAAKKAIEALDAFVAKHPDFAPARALRGLARLETLDLDAARADLVAARDAEPACLFGWFGLAELAIYEGDLEEAVRLLEGADRAGVRSWRLEELSAVVHRSIAGPLWTKVERWSTARFEVVSDHSETLCRRVAQQLESAVSSYERYFPFPAPRSRKSRVCIFSTEAGYHRYAGDRAVDLTGSAGAFDPTTRELVLFVPPQRAGFLHTIRHEGFHQFIDQRISRIPLWFNEGCAEYFAAGEKRKWGGGMTPGAVHLPALYTLTGDAAGEVLALRAFCLLSPEAFMANPDLHYAQAWAIVHYLREAGGADGQAAFDAYARALRDGASAEEAYDLALAPLEARIERGWRAHVRNLARLELR